IYVRLRVSRTSGYRSRRDSRRCRGRPMNTRTKVSGNSISKFVFKSIFPILAIAAGCSGGTIESGVLEHGDPFVAIPRKLSSDTFDPSLLVESYPVVETYAPFLGLPGHDKYVLFDPAAGLNRFGVLSDAYAQGSQPIHFQVDLSFMQAFRAIADGVTFEQVFA